MAIMLRLLLTLNFIMQIFITGLMDATLREGVGVFLPYKTGICAALRNKGLSFLLKWMNIKVGGEGWGASVWHVSYVNM